jgi:hypothetical protein
LLYKPVGIRAVTLNARPQARLAVDKAARPTARLGRLLRFAQTGRPSLMVPHGLGWWKLSSRSPERAREWVHSFAHWCNEQNRHSGIQFVTPLERRHGVAHSIWRSRKDESPKRRRSETRRDRVATPRAPVSEVWLNPENSETNDADIRDNAS